MKLVAKVGGASGPLYGTLFIALGKAIPEEPNRAEIAAAFASAIAAVQARAARAMPARRPCSTSSFRRSEAFAAGAATSPTVKSVAARRGGGDDPDARDARARVLPRRAFGRPRRSRRAIVVADDRGALR